MIIPNTFEPKMCDNFLVEFPEIFNIESWVVQRIDKPKFVNNEWQNIRIEFIDPIAPSTSHGLRRIVDFLGSQKEDTILFEIFIKLLDPTNAVIEKWNIPVKEVVSVDFGELDKAKNEIQKPSLVLKPFNCILIY